ncbi:MAG TPA: hypothetical protein VNP37_12580 [Actinomycetospora sp.]|nr:hypothetical protein [Actinomycetospora sp.]
MGEGVSGRGTGRVAAAATLLAAVSGVVDLWAVTSLGGPFAGVVTGNLVTLGGRPGAATRPRRGRRWSPCSDSPSGSRRRVAALRQLVALVAGAAAAAVLLGAARWAVPVLAVVLLGAALAALGRPAWDRPKADGGTPTRVRRERPV